MNRTLSQKGAPDCTEPTVTRCSSAGHHLSTLLGSPEWEPHVLQGSMLRTVSSDILKFIYRLGCIFILKTYSIQ